MMVGFFGLCDWEKRRRIVKRVWVVKEQSPEVQLPEEIAVQGQRVAGMWMAK